VTETRKPGTERVSAAAFKKLQKGSDRAHSELLEAVRIKLTVAGISVFTIYTGGIPRFIRGGEMVLRKNPHQIGLPDAFALIRWNCRCGARSSKLVLIETKTGKGRRTADQVRIRKLFESHGAIALLVRSVDDVDGLIEADKQAREASCRQPH
jgi:hypothetical protein